MGLALDEPQKNENTIQVNGIDILMDDEVKGFSDGNTIDYVKDTYGSGFIIKAAGRSGC